MPSWPLDLLFAGVLLVAELFTQTFYFLAVAIAFALLALADVLFRPGRIFSAVLFVVFAACLLAAAHVLRKKLRNESSRQTTALDSGRVVTVIAHQDDRLRVRYRGTLWAGRLAERGPLPPVGTLLTIVGREGNLLVLAPSPEGTAPPSSASSSPTPASSQ